MHERDLVHERVLLRDLQVVADGVVLELHADGPPRSKLRLPWDPGRRTVRQSSGRTEFLGTPPALAYRGK